MNAPKNVARLVGFCLLGISLLQWPSLLFVHLLPVSVWGKAAVYGGILLVGGIFFWSGSLILGGDFALKKIWERKRRVEQGGK